MLHSIQVRLLSHFTPQSGEMSAYAESSKLRKNLGSDWIKELVGKTVADFGCGAGQECVELATIASQVVGVDIEPNARAQATEATAHLNNVRIVERLDQPVDVIISLDAFEHFSDPLAMLRTMAAALAPGGSVIACFGPTWYHPLGGHLFSVFPWAHLVFSERALCEWRTRFRNDGARSFGEVEGGLNRMTIARFEQLVRQSGLRMELLETVPIRALAWAHSRPTREFTTALVKARLIKD